MISARKLGRPRDAPWLSNKGDTSRTMQVIPQRASCRLQPSWHTFLCGPPQVLETCLLPWQLWPLLAPAHCLICQLQPPPTSPNYPQGRVGVHSAPAMTVCDTGEVLPPKLVQGLKDFAFIELHWFLPASLLQTALCATEEKATDCHCCHTPETKRKLRTVSDIFTWLACFHRYTAALGKLYPGMVPHMMAYANIITQASLQFAGDGWRVYDRAFRIQAAARHVTDWSSIDPGLYARHVTGQTRRATICHFCSSSTHVSAACPWAWTNSAHWSYRRGPVVPPLLPAFIHMATQHQYVHPGMLGLAASGTHMLRLFSAGSPRH